MIQIKEDAFLIYPFEYLACVQQERLIVVLKNKKMMIEGHDLALDYYSANEIVGHGQIEAIRFLKE